MNAAFWLGVVVGIAFTAVFVVPYILDQRKTIRGLRAALKVEADVLDKTIATPPHHDAHEAKMDAAHKAKPKKRAN